MLGFKDKCHVGKIEMQPKKVQHTYDKCACRTKRNSDS